MVNKSALFCLLLLLKSTFVVAQNVAFKTKENDLIAEGIAFDSVTNSFFLSSIYKNKIVQVKHGKTSDFIKSGEYGFVGGVGLHVDSKNGILWACTGNILGNYYQTGIYAFNLENGDLIKKIFFPKDTVETLFNDITIANTGTIYISNTFENNVWEWNPYDPKPHRLIDGGLPYVNGITLHDNNEWLYVATSLGIKKINLIDHSTTLVEVPLGEITSKNLDGIVFYKNSILGVQDDIPENNEARIIRYFLNESGNAIEKISILDKDNPLFYGPTTLTIAKGYLYVLANSQLDNLDQTNVQIIDKKKLNHSLVLQYKLD